MCFAFRKLATNDAPNAFVRGFAVLWFTAMAVQFSSADRRGLWQPDGESTRDYVELALERVRRRQASVRFAWLLYLQVAFLFAWYSATLWPLELWSLVERTPFMLAMLGVLTLHMAAGSTFATRRNRAERREFEQLRRSSSRPESSAPVGPACQHHARVHRHSAVRTARALHARCGRGARSQPPSRTA